MRCDANISLRNTETGEFTSKVEVKNINSFKFIQNALEYEKERLLSLVEKGEVINPETRGWDSSKKLTISLRSKEGENDYRYFPEPDLPMLKISNDIMNIEIEELPDQMISRFVEEYKISDYNANVLISDKIVAEYFEKCVALFNNPVLISNWVISEILRLKSSNEISLSPVNFTKLLSMVNDGKINNNTAKEILEEIYPEDLDPEKIIEKRGLSQINDTKELEKLVLKVIRDNSKEYEAYKNGKTKLFGFFVGQVMKLTKGRANPKTVNKILREKLDS
jgi:aspartyl-tRNA(Asn)/glutamyl-tRNA(Gln) amidotransferase subunit B